MQKLLLVRFQSKCITLFGDCNRLHPSFYLTQNQTWRPHTTNWLSSRLLKQKCSHYKLGDFLPRRTSSHKKKPRSRNVKGKNHEWSCALQAYFIGKILADTASLPPSNLPSWRRSFLGESVKVNGRGKGTTKREAGSPDDRLASFLNKWHKLTSK